MTPEVAQFLLSRGENILQIANNNLTAYQMAMKHFGTPEIKKIFQEHYEKLTKSE